MAIENRTTLKGRFNTGDFITEDAMAALVDSAFNLADDLADTNTTNTVTFTKLQGFHSAATGTPRDGLTGDLTLDLTNSVVGSLQIIKHNDASVPAILGVSVVELVSLSANYVNNQDNYLFLLIGEDQGGNKVVFFNMKMAAVPVYKTIYIDAGAMAPSETDGAIARNLETATNPKTIDYYEFSTLTELSVNFSLPLPPLIDITGDIKAKVFWTDEAGSTGNADWAFQVAGLPQPTDVDTAFGAEVTRVDTLLAAQQMHVSEATDAIVISNSPVGGDMTQWRVAMKTGTSTLTSTKGLLKGVFIQYRELATVQAAW